MSTKYFNFNNEADVTPVEVNDETGVVTFTMGDETAEFNTLQEFAEFYAVARNVIPENLKNWEMTEDGNHFAFVLKVGTAGLNPEEIAGMVAGLQAAGMSPEEIGRAVAAASTTPTTVQPSFSQGGLHAFETQTARQRRIAQEVLGEYSELTIAFLKYSFDVVTDNELVDEIAGDDELFVAYNEDFDPWDDADDDDSDLTGEDALRVNLEGKISEVKTEMQEDYPELPVEAAIQIANDEFFSDDRNDFTKARMVATAASRALEVKVYSRADDETVSMFTNTFQFNTVAQSAVAVVAVKKHFVFVI